jgi:hypothetical protein
MSDGQINVYPFILLEALRVFYQQVWSLNVNCHD